VLGVESPLTCHAPMSPLELLTVVIVLVPSVTEICAPPSGAPEPPCTTPLITPGPEIIVILSGCEAAAEDESMM
jgi:hypothetical protein